MHIGLPAALEQFMMRVGSMIFSKSVASLGTLDFAAPSDLHEHPVAYPDERTGVSISATSLMGQSLGKRRPDMAQAYTSAVGVPV